MILIHDEIEKRISDSLSDEFESMFQGKVDQLSEIEEVISWVQQSRQNSVPTKTIETSRDEALTKISNKITEQLVQYIPNYMGEVIIENIRINTKGKQKNAKFDMSFVLDPFKPYVEIVKKVNGLDFVKIKLEFLVESDVAVQDIELILDQNKKLLVLDKMLVHIKITMLSSGSFSEEILLKDSEFELDLSGITLLLS